MNEIRFSIFHFISVLLSVVNAVVKMFLINNINLKKLDIIKVYACYLLLSGYL